MMRKLIGAIWLFGALYGLGVPFEAKDGFSIVLPDGWVEVPNEVLAGAAVRPAELVPGGSAPGFGYGYQRTGSDDRLCFPYILVSVNDAGRIPLRALSRYETLSDAGGPGSDVLVDKPVYDEVHHVLWSMRSIPVDGGGAVKALVAAVLIETGYIQCEGYATAGMFDAYAQQYRAIFAAVVVDEQIAYQPCWSDGLPLIGGVEFSTLFAAALNGAVAGGIIWFAMTLRRKKRNR